MAPPCFGSAQKCAGSEYIGAYKRFGIDDGTIHMAFGREVDYGVGLVGLEQILDKFRVADISMHKNRREQSCSEARFSRFPE